VDKNLKRGVLALSVLVVLGFVAFAGSVGVPYREARESDKTSQAKIDKLVEDYRARNELVSKWFPGVKSASDPSSLLGLDQAAFLEFDRREQLFFADITRETPTKEIQKPRKFDAIAWGKIEREIAATRLKYTEAAFERNEAWARVPKIFRNWLGIRPLPHFRADLAELRRSREDSASETN